MNKQFFFLSPVEVVKVTSQNLEEVAEWCGGSVQEAESRRVQGRMDKYVLVPTPSEKQISWAFPGMFITKRLVVTVKDELRATYAVFRRDYFEKNYFDTPKDAADKTWERAEVEKNRPKPAKKSKKERKPEVHLTVNVGEALLDAQRLVEELQKKLDATVVAEEDTPIEGVDETIMTAEIQEPKNGLDDLEQFVHVHSYLKSCDSMLCETPRYSDGLHYFEDAIGYAKDSETPTVWTNLEGEPILAPTDALAHELAGKSEAQIEERINGVSPDVDVVKAIDNWYANRQGMR